jgi:hypothetical protein
MSTPIELARIAAAVNLLRPDWPISSVQTLLENHHSSRPFHDLAVAAVWVATDPDSKTPARLTEAGPWWAALRTSSTPGPPLFDRDEWHAEFVAGATPAPSDFRELVDAARPVPVEAPPEVPDPEREARRAMIRAELDAGKVRQ